MCPPQALQADSDAAGGSTRGAPGCGIVFRDAWTVLKWPSYVNSDKKCRCGGKFRHKLTFLELCGHLLHLTLFTNEILDTPVRTNIDNEGTVCGASKGRSLRCQLTDCLISAINYVAVALGCKAYVIKVRRCSTVQAEAADSLSNKYVERTIPGQYVFRDV